MSIEKYAQQSMLSVFYIYLNQYPQYYKALTDKQNNSTNSRKGGGHVRANLPKAVSYRRRQGNNLQAF